LIGNIADFSACFTAIEIAELVAAAALVPFAPANVAQAIIEDGLAKDLAIALVFLWMQ
jgi:hypothetical protein